MLGFPVIFVLPDTQCRLIKYDHATILNFVTKFHGNIESRVSLQLGKFPPFTLKDYMHCTMNHG